MENNYLSCSNSQLNLDVVLSNGQAFRWKKEDGNCWIGIVQNRLWRIWLEDESKIGFKILHNFRSGDVEMNENNGGEILKEYFQLDIDLEKLYKIWSSKCSYFTQLLMGENRQIFEGIRILKQQPAEALFAFICSTNNNIARITKMIEKFCELYGTQAPIKFGNFFDFPTIPQLIANLPGMEQKLREAGFGYRAASISKTVQMLANSEWINKEFGTTDCWLNSLRLMPYNNARDQLMRLPGVGPKVADCICLMALGHHQVVPVDRHIFNLTAEIYKPTFLTKKTTLNKQIHKQIGEFYVELFGEHAGWIQSILFSSRLRRFK